MTSSTAVPPPLPPQNGDVFFRDEGRPPETRGRILLVSVHFGPGCGTGGLRWNALTRDLAARGWRFDVLTAGRPLEEQPDFPRFLYGGAVEIFYLPEAWWGRRLRLSANRLMEKARGERPGPGPAGASGSNERPARRIVNPEAAEVWQPGQTRPLAMRLKRAAQGATEFLRDWTWTRRALSAARRLAAERRYYAVAVTAPRYLSHLIGAALARERGLPYLADFRNTWCYGRGPHMDFMDDVSRLTGRYFEMKTLREADAIVHVTERARDAHAAALAGHIDAARYYVPNSRPALARIEAPDPNCFRVVFTGSLYPFMDVRPVLAACRRLRDRHRLRPKTFQIEFMGRDSYFGGYPLRDWACTYALSDYFTWRPRQPQEEAIRVQQRAAVMVAFDCYHRLCIPSKLYHYAQMKGALLLIGNTDSAMADEAAKIGKTVYDPADTAGLDGALEGALRRWRHGDFLEPIDPDGRFNAQHAGEKMHDIFLALRHSDPDAPRRFSSSPKKAAAAKR